MLRKVIAGHRGALVKKYGEKAVRKRIEPALARLVEADRDRGVDSEVIWLDRKEDLRPHGARPAAHPSHRRAVKAAIDRVAKDAYYVCLIGGPDVVPHQRLINPPWTGGGMDLDEEIASDLPYACEAPYSRSPGRYTAPVRCVGRLPDLAGANDPEALVRAIETAAAARPLNRSHYQKPLAISAAPFAGSAQLILHRAYGKKHPVLPCPKSSVTPALLQRSLHFYKCHGDSETPCFTGGTGPGGPAALRAIDLLQANLQSVVAAATCCYGAELYDPLGSGATEAPPPICNLYLARGASGFFGSTNLAWASEDGVESADLMVLDFVKALLRGASLGEAALTAQQRFVAAALPSFDPIELKTLAQFVLLGDPSVQPIDPRTVEERNNPLLSEASHGDGPPEQLTRKRLQQKLRVEAVGKTVGIPAPAPEKKLSPRVKKAISEAAAASSLTEEHRSSFVSRGGSIYARELASHGDEATHLVFGTTGSGHRPTALVVRELGGEVASVKRLVRAG